MSLQLTHEAYSLDSQAKMLYWWDDFLGSQIGEEWAVVGTGAVVDGVSGGVCRLTTAGTTSSYCVLNLNNIRPYLISKNAGIEYRSKLNSNTAVYNFLFFMYDWNSHLATIFDSAWNATYWYTQSENGGVGGNALTVNVIDTDYHIFRMQGHILGGNHAHFYIDGIETSTSPMTNTPTAYLQPEIDLCTLENVAKSMDIDYVGVTQLI